MSFKEPVITYLIWLMFSQTLILSFSHSSFVALPKKNCQSSGKKASKEERKNFIHLWLYSSLSLTFLKFLPCIPSERRCRFFFPLITSPPASLEAVTILFLLLLSLTLSALIQLFSLRLTAPEVNWKTVGRACVTTLTSANPEVARTISIPQAPYPQASVWASAFNPT